MNIAHPSVESAILRILELQEAEIKKQEQVNEEALLKEKELAYRKKKTTS